MSTLGQASNVPQQAADAKLMMRGAVRCMGCWQQFHKLFTADLMFVLYMYTSREARRRQASPLRHLTKAHPMTVCLMQAMYAYQLVGCRQMHNYLHSAHTMGEMLMIACMQ